MATSPLPLMDLGPINCEFELHVRAVQVLTICKISAPHTVLVSFSPSSKRNFTYWHSGNGSGKDYCSKPCLSVATGCCDQILQFHSVKHHLKPTWITVWLPEDQTCKKNPPFPSPTTTISNTSNLASLHFTC